MLEAVVRSGGARDDRRTWDDALTHLQMLHVLERMESARPRGVRHACRAIAGMCMGCGVDMSYPGRTCVAFARIQGQSSEAPVRVMGWGVVYEGAPRC